MHIIHGRVKAAIDVYDLPRIGMGSVALAHSLNQPTSAASLGRGCTRGAPVLHLGTYGAATPPCTIGRHCAPPPDTRQPRAGSCCCFRQHRTFDLWAHLPPSSMLHGSWCPSRSHMPAPGFTHSRDVSHHCSHLATSTAWSEGRKPARGGA